MILAFILISVGIALVTYGAHFMVDGASSIAKKLRVSDLVIGLTIVSFGTSAPELIVSLMAAVNGNTDVAVGNVIGSNLLNIWVILGITGVLAPLTLQSTTVWKEIPFCLLAMVAAWVLINDEILDGAASSEVSRIDGMILLLFFVIYLYYMFDSARNNRITDTLVPDINPRATWLSVVMIIGGIAGLTYGGKLIVDNAVSIAQQVGISDAIIGLTLVSIGTSIPELATSVVAAMKKNTDIAVGNVVGSNIFNTLLIMGTTSVVAPLPMAGISNIDFGICTFATFGLFISAFIMKKMEIYRFEAAGFLVMYGVYMFYLLSNVG